MADEQRPDQPTIPGGPPPGQPIPLEPVEGVDLEKYARVSAELAEHRQPRAAVLAAHALDDARWARIEQTWALRVAVAAMRGDRTLLEALDRHYLAAQDALGPTEPIRPLDRYAALVAKIEVGVPVVQVVREEGLTLADFGRLQRAWTLRIAADPALRDTFRAWVSAAARAGTS